MKRSLKFTMIYLLIVVGISLIIPSCAGIKKIFHKEKHETTKETVTLENKLETINNTVDIDVRLKELLKSVELLEVEFNPPDSSGKQSVKSMKRGRYKEKQVSDSSKVKSITDSAVESIKKIDDKEKTAVTNILREKEKDETQPNKIIKSIVWIIAGAIVAGIVLKRLIG